MLLCFCVRAEPSVGNFVVEHTVEFAATTRASGTNSSASTSPRKSFDRRYLIVEVKILS